MRTLTPTLQKPKTIQCNKSKHDSLNASPFTCVLDSEEIGIISENDHRVGKCLC